MHGFFADSLRGSCCIQIWLSLGPDMLPSSASAKSCAAAAKINILTLCEAVIIKHSGLGVVVKPTLEMCARFALLVCELNFDFDLLANDKTG